MTTSTSSFQRTFQHLYTIHGQKSGFTVPCVFALLPNKRKESYLHLFRQLKSWVDVSSHQWLFEAFLSDFEQGAFQAVLEVFPGIGAEGCFFHLCKRLDLQVKELGLMQKYRQDGDFKLRVKKLAALAFLPVADVIPTFESLSTTFLADELPLLAYFERTWIGLPAGGRRLPPMFDLHMWNVLDRASAGSTRTTNALESFHHTFNSLLLSTSHHLDPPEVPADATELDENEDAPCHQRRSLQLFCHGETEEREERRIQTTHC